MENNTKKEPSTVFKLFFVSLIKQDEAQASSLISHHFALEEGVTRTVYLKQEMEIFKDLSKLYKLNENIHVVSQLAGHDTTSYEVQIYNDLGQFVYEFSYSLDSDLKITGNESMCQSISKIIFQNGVPVCRSIAFESQKEILFIRPCFDARIISFVDTYNDNFKTFQFQIFNDVFDSFWADFQIVYKNGKREKKKIWLRGRDRPLFKNVNIIINKNQITHNAIMPWSISMKSASEEKWIQNPPNSLSLNENIVWACVTDAHDHDWIIGDVEGF